MSPDHPAVAAYALGYYHGRARGVDYQQEHYDELENWFYACGYEHGVADYCREAHPEEQT